jgi:hypothetical protein
MTGNAPAYLQKIPQELLEIMWSPTDAGRTLYTSHYGRLNRRGVTILLTAFMIMCLVTVLPAWLAHGGVDAAELLPLPVLTVGACGLWISSMRIRLCEHGLIVEPFRLIKSSSYVVPYDTIDPDSVLVAAPGSQVAFPYNVVGSRLWGNHVMKRYVDLSQKSYIMAIVPNPMNIFGAPGSRYQVTFRGLHPVIAGPRWRFRGSTNTLTGVPSRLEGLMHNWALLTTDPTFGPAVTARGVPAIRWFIGTDHPEPLLRALEAAMTAAGIPGAAGLADRALASPVFYKRRTLPDNPAQW